MSSTTMITHVSTSSNLDKIHKIINVKFSVHLSNEQLQDLIASQPEELKEALLAAQLKPATLDQLIETISEEITGIHYPTEHSTAYYKEYFKKKVQENKNQYFGITA